MSQYDVFTSESVSNGHPDKLADRISDAILDAMIAKNPESRVACETLIKSGIIVLAGETRPAAKDLGVDVDQIAREVVRSTGYTSEAQGMDPEQCVVINRLGAQSTDIAVGVDEDSDHEQGAGDQGMMFGYATNETDTYMPAPIMYSQRLMMRQAEVRNSTVPFLLPDAKCQLTFQYTDGVPTGVSTVVFSTQHQPGIPQSQITEAVMEEIIKRVLPTHWIDFDTKWHINPTGRFEIGGPAGDCGLTGRKIIVDTYGGMAHHGGGAFSGKDPSKVDRSAAYAVRHVAKNVVAAKLATRCEVQVSYAIGVAEPTSISVNTFGTNSISNVEIVNRIQANFDLRPKGLIDELNLKRPIYQATAAFGHFGRTEKEFTWEALDKKQELAH